MKRHIENLESRQEYLDKIDNKMFLSGMLDQEVSQSGNCQFSVIMVNSFAQVKWMKGKIFVPTPETLPSETLPPETLPPETLPSLPYLFKIRFEVFLRWAAN